MDIDPVATAGLLTREVRTSERDGGPTRIAVARRTYPTDPADLWDAVTDPERIPRWFLPVTGDLHVGGRYQLVGNAGGVVERCDPPTSFAITWEMGEQISWVEVTLTPAEEGTTLELRHEAPVDPDLWDRYGPGAVGIGWELGLMALGLHIDSGEPVDPEEGMAFSGTPSGQAFIRLTGTAWGEAAIADGDDPAEARAAAERTIDAYLPPPDSDASDPE